MSSYISHRNKGISKRVVLISKDNSITPVFRLVDVQRKRIVEFTTIDLGKVEYAALSYVWGGPQRVTLLDENREAMQQDGALQDLPRTLADAMAFTSALSLRYLWIDAICIVQDSNKDKAIQIGNMANIYSYSLITIIAATGTNADSGLCGVTAPRAGWQTEIHVPVPKTDVPMSLATSLNEIRDEDANFLTGTIWSTRGWTFQERELARRVIVFTEKQVYWVCEDAISIEETDMDTCPDNVARCDWDQMKEPRALTVLKVKSQHKEQERANNSKFYHDAYNFAKCVEYYQRKNLTNQGDAFDAFSAILQSIEDRTDETFLWGLPRSIFNTAIWWEGSLDDGPVTRRDALTTLEVTSLKQRVPFPSWTWVGWKDAVWTPAIM